MRYLHRDPGFYRFFLLLHLFTFGALLVFTADSLDLLIVGWETVAITSVLLVGFFQYRPEPVRNALWVFASYRVADLFMLLAIFLALVPRFATVINPLVPVFVPVLRAFAPVRSILRPLFLTLAQAVCRVAAISQ